MQREHDLCFNCDEKFHRGHKCASKAFLLIAEDDEGFLEDNPTMDPLLPNPLDTHDPPQAHISLHTHSGHLAPETLCLLGHIATQKVVILVDGGSTHNFI